MIKKVPLSRRNNCDHMHPGKIVPGQSYIFTEIPLIVFLSCIPYSSYDYSLIAITIMKIHCKRYINSTIIFHTTANITITAIFTIVQTGAPFNSLNLLPYAIIWIGSCQLSPLSTIAYKIVSWYMYMCRHQNKFPYEVIQDHK